MQALSFRLVQFDVKPCSTRNIHANALVHLLCTPCSGCTCFDLHLSVTLVQPDLAVELQI